MIFNWQNTIEGPVLSINPFLITNSNTRKFKIAALLLSLWVTGQPVPFSWGPAIRGPRSARSWHQSGFCQCRSFNALYWLLSVDTEIWTTAKNIWGPKLVPVQTSQGRRLPVLKSTMSADVDRCERR